MSHDFTGLEFCPFRKSLPSLKMGACFAFCKILVVQKHTEMPTVIQNGCLSTVIRVISLQLHSMIAQCLCCEPGSSHHQSRHNN